MCLIVSGDRSVKIITSSMYPQQCQFTNVGDQWIMEGPFQKSQSQTKVWSRDGILDFLFISKFC
jgi:hypothetical protein